MRVPLIGRPNVGKSSLFNLLLGEERAIVTPLPGTTRDRVSEAIEIAGIRVMLSDTAGLRDALESVEAIGVARTRQALGESRVALWVVDGAVPLESEDRWIAEALADKRVLVALNKCDLAAVVDPREIEAILSGATSMRIAPVSAATGAGVPQLRSELAELLGAHEPRDGMGAAIANQRHVESLDRARAALDRAADAGRAHAAGEIVALELREALSAIGEVTGHSVGEDLLDRIFSRFCVGK